MPKRLESPAEKLSQDRAAAVIRQLSAENKSMRRQIARLRGRVHELESGIKLAGLKEVKTPDYTVLEPSGPKCDRCGSTEIKVVKMQYKNAHKCKVCGAFWLKGENE